MKKVATPVILKGIFVILCLLAVVTTTYADSYQEVSIGYTRLNHELHYEVPMKFEMNSLDLGYGYFHSTPIPKLYLGAKLNILRSSEATNEYENPDLYSYTLDEGYMLKAGVRYHFSPRVDLGVYAGICEWHSTAKVNGKEPWWSDGTNSYKPCYSTHVSYRLNENWGIEGYAGLFYEKDKEDFGYKRTDSLGLALTYRF